jgi:hypothetical protein
MGYSRAGVRFGTHFCSWRGWYYGAMRLAIDPFRLLLISLAGWLNQRQQDVIDHLQEENRVLHEQLEGKRLRFNDAQLRRLAVRAKKLGWPTLHELTTIVTPATLLTWHRKLRARKYDGSNQQGQGRPRARDEIERLMVRMATENRDWGDRRIQGALANLSTQFHKYHKVWASGQRGPSGPPEGGPARQALGRNVFLRKKPRQGRHKLSLGVMPPPTGLRSTGSAFTHGFSPRARLCRPLRASRNA